MADIVFQPTFVHQEFVDGPDGDRVRADEPNGFNARFAAIESDLRQLSGVVGQIDDAVDRRGTGPAGHVLTLAPLLMAADGGLPWTITTSGAATASGEDVFYGQLEVALPDNARLTSFRAMGQAGNNVVELDISLSRVKIPGGTPEVLASVGGATDPFDRSTDVDPTTAVTQTATYRYLIQATFISGGGTTVTLAAFQIAYTTS
ncbi:hypothetical protein [Streptomyces sp. N50]|uniref:hypothetical protein n=1 Tax=Streptomyces sp. N50 TaxID=3081765 RepID=UPI002961E7F4|nr:hypothetical protein [Streptomyces sp. N50]WOX14105.1 hypothetical protein R2B38_37060 [Streptomyces sp. N50]